jgi:CRP-like cAMP-binding protein
MSVYLQSLQEHKYGSNGRKLRKASEVNEIFSKAAGFSIKLVVLRASFNIKSPVVMKLLFTSTFHRIAPRKVILIEVARAKSVDLILEGSVMVCRVGPDNREVILGYLGRGDYIDDDAAVLCSKANKDGYKSREDCNIAEVPIDRFFQICNLC